MKHNILTDEEVENEIVRLRKDPDVKLAKAEERIRYRRRQQMYQLRSLKKKGEEIRKNPEYAWLVKAFEDAVDSDYMEDENYD